MSSSPVTGPRAVPASGRFLAVSSSARSTWVLPPFGGRWERTISLPRSSNPTQTPDEIYHLRSWRLPDGDTGKSWERSIGPRSE